MAGRPINLTGPEVRAILEGRKTMARLVLNQQTAAATALKIAPGERLWVREAWNQFCFSQDGDEAWPSKEIVAPLECAEIAEEGARFSPPQLVYRESERAKKWVQGQRWRSGAIMPRWASRLTLIVDAVKVERLQDISEEDAQAEGAEPLVMDDEGAFYQRPSGGTYRCGFAGLWAHINGPGSWDANPWVAAITFRPVFANIDSLRDHAAGKEG